MNWVRLLFATTVFLLVGIGTIYPQSPGEVIYCGSRHSKMIAITIDDGWVDDWELLNLLSRYKVKCTVFIPGRVIVSRPYFVATLAKMGFEIGNHTYSHHILDKKSVAEIRWDIKRCEELIMPFSPNAPKYFRPSSGIISENVIQAAKEEGYAIILWKTDSRVTKGLIEHWKRPSEISSAPSLPMFWFL